MAGKDVGQEASTGCLHMSSRGGVGTSGQTAARKASAHIPSCTLSPRHIPTHHLTENHCVATWVVGVREQQWLLGIAPGLEKF